MNTQTTYAAAVAAVTIRFRARSAGVLWACVLGVAVCLRLSPIAAAQDAGCGSWLPFDSLPGGDATVHQLLSRDPDGAGPLPSEIVALGSFRFAGDARARCVARWDGVRWSALGEMVDADDYPALVSIAVVPNGDVLLSGTFESIGGRPARGLVRWDGTTWWPADDSIPVASDGGVGRIAVAPDGTIYASTGRGIFRKQATGWVSIANEPAENLRVGPTGELYAYGRFTQMGGAQITGLARWSGGEWAPVGGSISGSRRSVDGLACFNDGSLVISGVFTAVNGVPAPGLARWDGQQWSAFPGITYPSLLRVQSIRDRLVLSGNFDLNGQYLTGHFEWDGQEWTRLNYPSTLGPICETPEGELFAPQGSDVVAQVGDDWLPIGGSDICGDIYSLVVSAAGETVCGGDFIYGGGTRLNRVAVRRDDVWCPMGQGLPSTVGAMLTLRDGRILAAMSPGMSGADRTGSVMAWDGRSWSELGSGFGGGGSVRHLAQLPDGSVVATGRFTTAGGVAANRIARWDGTLWHPLGSGPGGPAAPTITGLAVALDGQLFVAGDFSTMSGAPATRLARWNGTTWTGVPGAPHHPPAGLATLPSGELVMYGVYSLDGSQEVRYICRWNGTEWTPMAPRSTESIYKIAISERGEVFTFFDDVLHRLVNSEWVAVSGRMVGHSYGTAEAMIAAPNGEVHVGGRITRAFGRWSPAPRPSPTVEAFTDTPLVASDSNIRLRATASGNQHCTFSWEIENDDGWRVPFSSSVYRNHEQIGWVRNSGSDMVVGTFYPDPGEAPLRFRCVIRYSPCLAVTTEPVAVQFCIADFDRNGEVDWNDLALFVARWDSNAGYDINRDWRTDADDLALFITRWEAGC